MEESFKNVLRRHAEPAEMQVQEAFDEPENDENQSVIEGAIGSEDMTLVAEPEPVFEAEAEPEPVNDPEPETLQEEITEEEYVLQEESEIVAVSDVPDDGTSLDDQKIDIELNDQEVADIIEESTPEDLDEEDEDRKIATLFVDAGLITLKQCEKVEEELQQLHAMGQTAQFREVVVQLGYCSRGQIAELLHELRNKELLKDQYVPSAAFVEKDVFDNPNLMGARLVTAGIVTSHQRDKIVERQQKLAVQGTQIRFGELAVQMGFCTEEELDAVLDDIVTRHEDESW